MVDFDVLIPPSMMEYRALFHQQHPTLAIFLGVVPLGLWALGTHCPWQ